MNNEKTIYQNRLSDFSGAGYFRNLQIFQHLSHKYSQMFHPIISHGYFLNDNILEMTKSLFIQRDFSESGLRIIRSFKEKQKKYGFKIIYELDDYFFGKNDSYEDGDFMEGVPSYSYHHLGITPGKQDEWCLRNMKEVDEVTVTTEFLAKEIRKKTGHSKVTVIPISIPYLTYGRSKIRISEQSLKRPSVMYIGSSCHYGDEHNKLPGDFSHGWISWLRKNIIEEKINFTIVGGLPFFLDDLKGKFKYIQAMPIDAFMPFIRNCEIDFTIAPLTLNKFNQAKSDLKILESTSMGAVIIGSYFDNYSDIIDQGPYASLNHGKIPYTSTPEQIDNIFWSLTDKNKFKEELEFQLKYCKERYTESPYIEKKWIDVLSR